MLASKIYYITNSITKLEQTFYTISYGRTNSKCDDLLKTNTHYVVTGTASTVLSEITSFV